MNIHPLSEVGQGTHARGRVLFSRLTARNLNDDKTRGGLIRRHWTQQPSIHAWMKDDLSDPALGEVATSIEAILALPNPQHLTP